MFNLWNSLLSVSSYEYESAPGPKSVTGWVGNGSGRVTVTEDAPNVLRFTERGTFTLAESGHSVNTQNEFIWHRRNNQCVHLSHTRYGRDKPVDLFALVYDAADDEWISEAAHVCGDDLYSGRAVWIDGAFHFFWSISGPRKQENLHYRYTKAL